MNESYEKIKDLMYLKASKEHQAFIEKYREQLDIPYNGPTWYSREAFRLFEIKCSLAQ